MRIDGTGLSLAQILAKAAEHEREFPTHGTNCACMDGLIQAVRQATAIPGSDIHDPSAKLSGLSTDPQHPFFGQGTPWRQQKRVDYVLGAVVRSRT